MADAKDSLPRNVAWELARLKTFTPINAESVSFHEADGVSIKFEIETDHLIDAVETPILDVEPITLLYPSTDAIGRLAPVVFSGRGDFPREWAHLNPTGLDKPASFCLARAGIQAIYDAHGIDGIALRLLDWLNDAKTGSLHKDGWHPVPAMAIDNCVVGFIDAEHLQRYIADHPEGGYSYICAGLSHGKHDAIFLQAASPPIDTNDSHSLFGAKAAMQAYSQSGIPHHTSIPAILLWPPESQIDQKPHFNTWTNIDSLRNGLRETDLYDLADEAFLKLDFLFSNDPNGGSAPDTDKRGSRSLLVIAGLRRPMPLDKTIVGLADDDLARSIELRAYYLERSIDDKNRWSDKTALREFYGLTPAAPSILAAVSGESAFPSSVLLGAGALGSNFADYAFRGGCDSLTVIDKDILLPHNMARHRGETFDIHDQKVDVIERMANSRAQDITVRKLKEDIVSLDDEALKDRFVGADQVLDLTADPLVRRRLSKLDGIDLPVMRTEIFHQGRLGVSLLTHLNSRHSLNMLFYQLLALANDSTRQDVRSWLGYESSRTFMDEELLLGFGCRSLTTKMPAYKIDAHASAAYALAKSNLENLETPIIALHSLDDAGVSRGITSLTPHPIIVFDDPTQTNGWTVVVSEAALKRMQSLRIEHAPNETGGYLFGAIDEAAEEIYVLAASSEPPGTVASPSGVQLGGWGNTGFEQAFIRRTTGRLPPIGTWHSHPASEPIASQTDWSTVNGFLAEDAMRGLPTIMAITGEAQDRVYVVED